MIRLLSCQARISGTRPKHHVILDCSWHAACTSRLACRCKAFELFQAATCVGDIAHDKSEVKSGHGATRSAVHAVKSFFAQSIGHRHTPRRGTSCIYGCRPAQSPAMSLCARRAAAVPGVSIMSVLIMSVLIMGRVNDEHTNNERTDNEPYLACQL